MSRRTSGLPTVASAACLALLAGGAIPAAAAPAPEGSISACWDSLYVSEGRDNLDGQSLASATALVGWPEVSFGGWYAVTSDGTYREINIWAGGSFDLGPVELGLSCTRLEFRARGLASVDNELSAALAVPLPAEIETEFSAVYSTEAAGTILAGRVWRTWEAGRGAVRVTPFAAGAFDFGYVSPAHNGPNHLEAGLEVQVKFGKHMSAAVYLTHAVALANLERDGFGDVTWGGLRLTASF